MQCLCTIKKSGNFEPWRQNAVAKKIQKVRPSPSQNMLESQFSCIFREPVHRGKYAYVGLWIKYDFAKKSYVSKIQPVVPKKTENNCFRVPIHFATNRFTLKKSPPPPELLHPKTKFSVVVQTWSTYGKHDGQCSTMANAERIYFYFHSCESANPILHPKSRADWNQRSGFK